ncbi:MAG: 16S rRNA (adenine(1518)-N(6)/adenine(1519)-N(6))-dimethyltransferase RsmA [Gemmatimonadaceae bacterium]
MRRQAAGERRPRKRLGQHFLRDRRILRRVVETLAPQPDETVVEIGPGHGTLTDLLLPRAARIVAIELDGALAASLRARLSDVAALEVLQADVLDVPLASLVQGTPWSVVGNIPYYITTPIVFHALAAPRPRVIVLLIQREVADRLVAAAGTRAYGALSVTAQAVAEVRRHFRVAPGAFSPAPSVESAVVSLTPRHQPLVTAAEEPAFKALVQGTFSLRRKQMLRVTRTLLGCDAATAGALLDESGVMHDDRPEVLQPESFVRLLRAIRRAGLRVPAPGAPA